MKERRQTVAIDGLTGGNVDRLGMYYLPKREAQTQCRNVGRRELKTGSGQRGRSGQDKHLGFLSETAPRVYRGAWLAGMTVNRNREVFVR